MNQQELEAPQKELLKQVGKKILILALVKGAVYYGMYRWAKSITKKG